MIIKRLKYSGFTLIEMAIVLVIFGLILSAFLLPLRAQREQAAQALTVNTLDRAKQALLGFAQSKGRLPCPAVGSSGVESQAAGICVSKVGFLPAVTLGVQPADSKGFAIDAWNNKIGYAVTGSNANAFVISQGISDVGISALAPDFKVACGQITTTECTPANLLISNAVAVIYSTGANGGLLDSEVGADEIVNKNATTTFYSRIQTAKGSAAGEFDDLVTWISPYILYNAMIQAGQLH